MKIAVEIKAGKKYCGGCSFKERSDVSGYYICTCFRELLNIDITKRLPECIAAEIKE
jgi:hypothetical protein